MKECKVNQNMKHCNCTYPCSNKGICCDCITYHRNNGELPACYFPAHLEKTYNRSITFYYENVIKGK